MQTLLPLPSTAVPPTEPLRSWAKDAEAVVVMMHPFMRLKGLSYAELRVIEDFAGKFCLTDDEVSEIGPRLATRGPLESDHLYPPASLLKRAATPVSWSHIAHELRLSVRDVAVGLQTSIGAGGNDCQDKKTAEMLEKFADSACLFYPAEGGIPPLLEAPIGTALANAGIKQLHLVSEFGRPERIVAASELVAPKSVLANAPQHSRLVSSSLNVVIASHWDSFWTVVAGPREFVAQLTAYEGFDPHTANRKTSNAWWIA